MSALIWYDGHMMETPQWFMVLLVFASMAVILAFAFSGEPSIDKSSYTSEFRCTNGITTPVGAFTDVAASGDVFCGRSSGKPTYGALVCWKPTPCKP